MPEARRVVPLFVLVPVFVLVLRKKISVQPRLPRRLLPELKKEIDLEAFYVSLSGCLLGVERLDGHFLGLLLRRRYLR